MFSKLCTAVPARGEQQKECLRSGWGVHAGIPHLEKLVVDHEQLSSGQERVHLVLQDLVSNRATGAGTYVNGTR